MLIKFIYDREDTNEKVELTAPSSSISLLFTFSLTTYDRVCLIVLRFSVTVVIVWVRCLWKALLDSLIAKS